MTYSYLKNSPQAQAYFASLPQPGTFSPQIMSPSGAIAPAPARVAVVKKQVAAPVIAQPMQQVMYGAPPAMLPAAPATPMAQPTPKGGFTGLVKQALQAIKGGKWYVAWPIAVGLMFLAFKALALEVAHDADVSVATPSVAASEPSTGNTAMTKITATQTSTATTTEPLTMVTTGQPHTANNIATNNAASNSEAGIVLKPATAMKANSKDTKQPASAQDLRVLGIKLAVVEEKLAVAEELRAGQAQAMAKLQEENATAAVLAASMAHATSQSSVSTATNAPLPVASIAEAISNSKRGAAWTQALLALVGFMAIALGGLTLGWCWKRAGVLSAIQARYDNRQNGASGMQPFTQSSAEQSNVIVATSPTLTRAPVFPAVDATESTTVVVRPITTPEPAFPVSTLWSFGSFGLKGPIRDEMQDAYAHFMLPGGAFAVVVADGVGGEPHGAMAAQMAVAATKASLLANVRVGLTETMDAVDAAGRAIAEHAKQNGIQYGLRTTLMVMVRIDSTAHYACLGDGGLYHLRGNDGIVTTLFQPQRDKAGYLLASLGPNTAGQPLAGSLHLAPGDILLSGTDGIWERTPDAAALATWLVQSMRRTHGDVQTSLQNSLTEFVQIQSGGSFVADDNASIGCLATGSAPAFLYPQQTFTQLQTVKELSHA